VRDVGRRGVATANLLGRIQKEKGDVVCRLEALTVREIASGSKESGTPGLRAGQSGRRFSEKGAVSSKKEAGYPVTCGPPEDPVASAWRNARDACLTSKSGPGGKVKTVEKESEAKTDESVISPIVMRDGASFAPAVPQGKENADVSAAGHVRSAV
jgi:hypothetical protein